MSRLRQQPGSDGRWRLPDGVEEVLPDEAWHLENLRSRLLTLYSRWGYDLVIPPLIEYLDSLLIGVGHDLDIDTFKLVDQLTGRMMGLRADMTPQVARIDAHRLQRPGPTRLCYLGAVLHTRPGPFGGGRSPLQLGAELYGHGGADADLEILDLVLATLDVAGINRPLCIDLGHVGIVRALARGTGIEDADEATLFEMLQRKSIPDIDSCLDTLNLPAEHARMWRALAGLHGDRQTLDRARAVLAPGGEAVVAAIDDLAALGDELAARHPAVELHFDPAELRGYRYHSGAVFAVYVDGEGEEVARGGRYDGIGAAFGQSRAATGFSTDLRRLARLAPVDDSALPGAIAAPADADARLSERVAELRAVGERVIAMLPGQEGSAADAGCDRQLIRRDGEWIIEGI